MASLCMVKRTKLAQGVAGLQGPSSLVSRLSTGLKAGFIAAPATVGRGLLGNTVSLGVKTLPLQPAQAGVDYLASLGRATYESAKRGKMISPLEYRTVINGTNLQGYGAFKRGVKKGWQEVSEAYTEGRKAYENHIYDKALPGSPFTQAINAWVQEAKLHIVDANKTATLLDYTPTQFKHPLSQAMADAAFLFVEAVDRPAYYAAEEMSLTMQKRLAAMKAGATGKQIDIIASQMQTTDDMALQATIDAQRVTFKNRGIAAKSIEQVKRGLERGAESENAGISTASGAALLLANTQMPFTGVPTSIATQGVELTGLGALGLLANLTVDSKGSFPRVKLREKGLGQARNSQIIANTLVGTGAVAYGYWLAENGYITGKLTKAEREENPKKKEYSLNTPWGSFGLQTLSHVAAPLFAGAALHAQRKKDPSLEPASIDGAIAVARSAGEQTVNATYMQGLKQTVDAFGSEDKPLSGMFANAVPIPSLMTQASRAIDPQPREARTFVEKVMNKTPFSAMLPEATSATGVVPARTTGERLAAFLSPVSYTAKSDSPALDELQRLGVNIGKPAKVMQKDNVKAELSPLGMKAITEEQGKLILPLVEQRLRDPEYLAWTDEKKQNYWEKVVSAQKARAKLEVRKKFSDTTSGFFTGARR